MSKTNTELVEYVKSKTGTAYVYGCKMEVLTREKYDWLKKTYGSLVWDSDAAKIGKMCVDCSGLISAYTGKLRGSSQYKQAAKEVFPISSIANAPAGALVWKEGHIGIYVGQENATPMYIAADGSAYGTRKAKLPSVFTHWFLCTDIVYTSAGTSTTEQPLTEFPRVEVMKAIQELERRGIIVSPQYWNENFTKLKHLDRLLVNMSAYLLREGR